MGKLSKCLTGLKAKHTAILGAQWGDEGKGKLVDILAEKYDFCARFNGTNLNTGGANAGHTVVANKIKYAFHLLPCGILYPNCVNILGNGVVVNVKSMLGELAQLDRDRIDYKNRLIISDRAQLVTQLHIESDKSNETDPSSRFLISEMFIGTTKQGIGPTYASKSSRYGIRVGDLKDWSAFKVKYGTLQQRIKEQYGVSAPCELEEFEKFRTYLIQNNMIQDTVVLLNKAINSDKRLLFEGANAAMLDIDFGTYPYVTSSSTVAGGICTGLGVPPNAIGTTIGIVKAYLTRVGEGSFPTELKNEIGAGLQKIGREFGATTGRPRRCGWIDIPMLRYAQMLNSFDSFNLTKIDVMDHLDEVKIGVQYRIDGKKIDYMPSTLEEYKKVQVDYETYPGWKTDLSKFRRFEDLPVNAKNYISRIEELSGIPITWIGVGPERESIILRN